jgi:beta-glucosidase
MEATNITQSKTSVEERIDALVSQMTLHEKVSLLAGRDLWRTMPIPRLGIPSVVMTDGPHGVRSDGAAGRFKGPATSFPTGVSMASTWDPALIEQVGAALADETHAMGCDILLGPCVNIARLPLAGRNFEAYSEDPFLAGRIAVGWIKGLQSRGAGASLKHYACNNQETERYRGSSEVDERTLREIYLPAFEAAVKEAQPWTVMHSYNRINGVYAAENEYLLTQILRQEWGFKGAVISDWTATHSTVPSVKAGLDIEMPGPAKWFGELLEHAVRTWQVDESVIDAAARRVLGLIFRSGKMDNSTPAGSVNTPEHQVLARQVAEQSIVLLKNDKALLPLDATRLKSIAVIGPNAAECRIGGGGSSYLEPPYRVSPLEALKKKLGNSIKVEYELGCLNVVQPVEPGAEFFIPANGKGHGLSAEYFEGAGFSGKPVAEETVDGLSYFWFERGPVKAITSHQYAARFSGSLIVPFSGESLLVFGHTENCKFYLDGKLLFDDDFGALSLNEIWDEQEKITRRAHVTLEAGKPYDLRVEYVKSSDSDFAAIQFAYMPPVAPDSIQRAAQLAARCDVALVFAGMPIGFESEGHDQPDMDMPGQQTELIRSVVKANPHTVVVLNAGSPVNMPWLDEIPALLEAYYPGQEGGNAVANVLLGDVNPSGKLTVTFPKRLEDSPAFINFPGTKEVFYGEGIFVGYRYYDKKDLEPLFPFGFGLSYTTFEYSGIAVSKSVEAGEPVKVSVRVKNTGARPGKEVMQVYVSDKESGLVRPPKELKAFKKVALEPGESRLVEFELDERALSYYDPYLKQWVAEPGEFEVLVGASSRDIRQKASFNLV